ncbi:Sulfurtransferase TusE [Thiorhodovibrio winogradskyi]|uniref:Sulfurtransferase TusE n=1 Tax=Thiorhodovibrio winogradskyi TaxID=77007 RepID=A0ABZ0SCU0_9GAMM|nr:TusE/DsrC/DsvC family sulfur relay protein [Thiorhodovibrio winogradskyi]
MMQPTADFSPAYHRFTSIHQPLPLDEDGFVIDPNVWTDTLACLLTALDGRGTLEPEHWSIIYHLREHFLSYNALPPMSQICHEHSMMRTRVKELFGSCRAAWRTAGLPNPGPEALAYMS